MSEHKSAAVVVHEDVSGLSTEGGDAARVLATIQAGAIGEMPVEKLSQMLDLYERVRKIDGIRAFDMALADFQQHAPAIQKTRTAKITTASGGGYSFTYADYETIANAVRPALAERGFSFTFDTSATPTMCKVTCTLRHRLGHSVSASFECPTENKSGATPQQKFGGARQYGKRMTLIDVLGLTLTDDGGPQDEGGGDAVKVSEDQAQTLMALMDETKVDRAKWLAHYGIASVSDLPAATYAKAAQSLEKRRKAVQS